MSERRYKAALERIVALCPARPGVAADEESPEWEGVDGYAGGNVDDAYAVGKDAGMWYASEIAQEALSGAAH